MKHLTLPRWITSIHQNYFVWFIKFRHKCEKVMCNATKPPMFAYPLRRPCTTKHKRSSTTEHDHVKRMLLDHLFENSFRSIDSEIFKPKTISKATTISWHHSSKPSNYGCSSGSTDNCTKRLWAH